MSWLYLPELVADYSLPGGFSDGEPSAMSNSRPTPSASCRPGSAIDTSTMPRSGTTQTLSTGVLGLDAWISSLRASRASRSVSLASSAPTAISAMDGLQPSGLFARYDRRSSCWKTLQGCFPLWEVTADGISDEFSETWPRAGILRDGECYLRRRWERRINATGFSFSDIWPTPTVTGNNNRPGVSENSGLGLATAVRLWPTPTAADGRRAGNFGRGDGNPTLAGAVKLWPTPTVSDFRGPNLNPGTRSASEHSLATVVMFPTPTTPGGGRSVPADAVWNGNAAYAPDGKKLQVGLETVVRRFPTPTTKDNRPTSQASMERGAGPTLDQFVGGTLNPDWVEWLMGWPTGWTDCAPLAADRFLLWLRQFGICCGEDEQ